MFLHFCEMLFLELVCNSDENMTLHYDTPLMSASWNGDIKIVQCLLKAGAGKVNAWMN